MQGGLAARSAAAHVLQVKATQSGAALSLCDVLAVLRYSKVLPCRALTATQGLLQPNLASVIRAGDDKAASEQSSIKYN